MKTTTITIINSVEFPDGNVYQVGELTDFSEMPLVSIEEVLPEERMNDEVITLGFSDGVNGEVITFNKSGEFVA